MTTQAELDDRYGRTKRSSVRAWLVVAAVVGVIIACTLGYFVVDKSRSTVGFDDLGFEVVDSGHVDVHYRVTLPKASDAVCVIEALDEGFAKVGWQVVEIPASESISVDHTSTVRTVDTATTGRVVSCSVR